MPDLATHAARLVRASAKKSFDPFVAIDWSVPLDDRAYHLPPEILPLYGTEIWERMDEPARIAYSRHQTAALCGAGIWLENVLMQLLVQHLYELPPDDPTLRYLLVEIGDECRHSSMFSEYVKRAGTPAYRPDRWARLQGKLVTRGFGGTSSFIAVLAAEELLDAMNRQTARADGLHPVSRGIARIHVTEEARHVSFAKAWLGESFPKLGPVARRAVTLIAPLTVRTIAGALVNPDVYATLGIRGGSRAARTNPVYRAKVAEGLERLTGFFTDVGIIDRWTLPLWHKLGLVRTLS